MINRLYDFCLRLVKTYSFELLYNKSYLTNNFPQQLLRATINNVYRRSVKQTWFCKTKAGSMFKWYVFHMGTGCIPFRLILKHFAFMPLQNYDNGIQLQLCSISNDIWSLLFSFITLSNLPVPSWKNKKNNTRIWFNVHYKRQYSWTISLPVNRENKILHTSKLLGITNYTWLFMVLFRLCN